MENWHLRITGHNMLKYPDFNTFFKITRCGVTDDLISESFMQDQRYLKYRSFTLRISASALYLSEDIYPPRETNGNTAQNGDIC